MKGAFCFLRTASCCCDGFGVVEAAPGAGVFEVLQKRKRRGQRMKGRR